MSRGGHFAAMEEPELLAADLRDCFASFGCLLSGAERSSQMNDHSATQAGPECQTKVRTRTRARAKITVRRSEATPYDQATNPALLEIRLSEITVGDIDGGSMQTMPAAFLTSSMTSSS